MLLLKWFPCSITVDGIGDEISDDLQADILTIISERMSNMYVGGFGFCSLLAMHTYEGSHADPSLLH